jgi:hypothetical protein
MIPSMLAQQSTNLPAQREWVAAGVKMYLTRLIPFSQQAVPFKQAAGLAGNRRGGVNDPYTSSADFFNQWNHKGVVGAAQYDGVNPFAQHGGECSFKNVTGRIAVQAAGFNFLHQTVTGIGHNFYAGGKALDYRSI